MQEKSSKKKPCSSHGYSSLKHPLYYLYYTWISMKQRCNNPNVKNYHIYGGRGIKVCPEWENDFVRFKNDMGERPNSKYSIDRIDNEKGYSPDNCRWATKEQNCNNTSLNIFYEHNGCRLSETQWSRKLGLSRNKFMWWIRKNGIQWVIENVDNIKKMRRGLSDAEYKLDGLGNKRRTTHGANDKNSPLYSSLQVYRSFKWNHKSSFLWNEFEIFLNDMGKKPENKTLKRINKSEPFFKENCYWG